MKFVAYKAIKKYESDNDLSGSFTLCYSCKYSYWIKKVNNYKNIYELIF